MTYTTHSEAHSAFREFVREMTEPITIAGVRIDPAAALAASDGTAYRSAYISWAEGLDLDIDYLDGVDGSDPRSDNWDGSGAWR